MLEGDLSAQRRMSRHGVSTDIFYDLTGKSPNRKNNIKGSASLEIVVYFNWEIGSLFKLFLLS